MASFFISGACSDPGYGNVRDGEHNPLLEGRAFTESLWARYAPLADSHFREDARAHFIERFWEMYLGVAFLERGFDVSPGSGTGPEFSFNQGGLRFWVEAVAPGPGTGPDRVLEIESGVAYTVPTEKILLRFANAVVAKRRQYSDALEAGIVAPDDGYLLAINSRRIPHAPYGNTLPFYIQALLPFGDLTLMLNRSTREIEDRFYQAREEVLKGNAAPVNTQPLLNPEFSFISAVLHSAVDCVNRPEHLGGEFSILHNPLAACPLNLSTFSWCDQYFYRDGVLEKRAANGRESAAGVAMADAERVGGEMTIVRVLAKSVLTVFVFVFAILFGAAVSEVTLGRAGATATPLIWAVFVPCLVAIWHPAKRSKRIVAAAVGSGVGLLVWTLGRVAFDAPFVGATVATGAFVVSGVVALIVCRR